MTDTVMDGACKRNCWIGAGVVGLVVALFALGAHKGIVAAILLGVLTAALLGALLVWMVCAPVPKLAPRKPSAPEAAPSSNAAAAAPLAQAAPEPAAEASAPKTADEVAPDSAPAPETGESASVVKPSKPLPGEADLDSRKGSWRYEPDATTGDDTVEAEGSKPEALSAPREGGADDLKEIKGVGPKLETLLHEHGIFHFEQIAGWGAEEVAWMDANLQGFRGRVSRDDWVGQAKILAAGSETEFSQRVDDGEVY
ncbi:MAG: endonuclease [Rhodobacteraceae bacterium]|jgi:predicted flap endonuclease-1-like 5' DNA nuclease|uniref:endonuclease n=1 Tax=Salipiger TaxID=263377 RepID=UPI0008EAC74B|nr:MULTISPECIES: endonuclease [Salipiger]MAB06268.1 endonuclease [Paracoccaceae bacterium]GGA04555.1 hypothetical protein GCM10011326_15430 [Salipiger profundus]SFD71602.1 NADH-quinone oxidoreductase subunit E [Salipiger profundus]